MYVTNVNNHVPWASYQIGKIAGCACAGNARNDFPHGKRKPAARKPLASDPDIHHGTCVTHVPWCMSGSLTRGGGENVPGIPGACAPAILRIWQEAHVLASMHFVEVWSLYHEFISHAIVQYQNCAQAHAVTQKFVRNRLQESDTDAKQSKTKPNAYVMGCNRHFSTHGHACTGL